MEHIDNDLLNIVIVDHHPITAYGIECRIKTLCNAFCISTTSLDSLKDQAINPLMIDLWIIDIQFIDECGWETINSIMDSFPKSSILAYTRYGSKWVAAKLQKTGVNWAVSKGDSLGDFDNTIRHFINKTPYYSDSLKISEDEISDYSLTLRQMNILMGIINGQTTMEIADKIGITENTVLTYRKQLMAKFGVHKIIDLVKSATGAEYQL